MTTIEVLGPGCRRCREVERIVREVVDGAGIRADVRSVTDPAEIVRRGFLMRTPGLVVDGVVVATGRVPSRQQVLAWLGVAPAARDGATDAVRRWKPVNPFRVRKGRSQS